MFGILSNTDRSLLLKQVMPLFESTRAGGLANIFAVWLVYGLVIDTHHHANALVMGIIITFLSVTRILLSDEFLRTQTKNLNVFLGSHLFFTLIIGTSWGIFALMQTNQDDALHFVPGLLARFQRYKEARMGLRETQVR